MTRPPVEDRVFQARYQAGALGVAAAVVFFTGGRAGGVLLAVAAVARLALPLFLSDGNTGVPASEVADEDGPSWPVVLAVLVLCTTAGLGLAGWLAGAVVYCGDPCTDLGFWRWDRFVYALGGTVVFGAVIAGALWLSRHIPTGTRRVYRAALAYAVVTTLLGAAGFIYVVPLTWLPCGWILFLSARRARTNLPATSNSQ